MAEDQQTEVPCPPRIVVAVNLAGEVWEPHVRPGWNTAAYVPVVQLAQTVEAALGLARWTQHSFGCARSETTAVDCTCGLQEAWAVLDTFRAGSSKEGQ